MITHIIASYGYIIIPSSVVLVVAAIWLIREAIIQRAIRAKGITIDAQVIKHRQSRGRDVFFYITFKYEIADTGRTKSFSREQAVGKANFQKLADGTSVKIRYMPDSPSVARLTDQFEDNATFKRTLYLYPFFLAAYLYLIYFIVNLK